MAAEKGSAFLIKISDEGNPATYSTIAGMRTTGLTISAPGVDITHKGSNGWRELLDGAGLRSVSIRGSGVFTDSAAEQLVQQKVLAGSHVDLQIVFESGDFFSGLFRIVSLEHAGDHGGERTYTIQIESAGPVSLTNV